MSYVLTLLMWMVIALADALISAVESLWDG